MPGEILPTVIHVTHWKAGSQWIRRILSACAPDRIVEPTNDQKQYLYARLVPGAVYPTVYVTREQFLSVPRPLDSRRFVIIRDLRDTLVSGYFSFRFSQPTNHPSVARWRRLLNELDEEAGLAMLMDEWLPASAAIQASWLASNEPCIRYEDLMTDDLPILEPLLRNRCGFDIDRDRLRQVIVENRLESVTRGRQPGDDDVSAHERNGQPGDWRNHFSEVLSRTFDERYGRLLQQSGYERRRPVSRSLDTLRPVEVNDAYETVSGLYPFVPPLSHWRAWELAAYRRHSLAGRVLDLGCGDGRYFRLLWPEVKDAVGVDSNPGVAELARGSGVYKDVIACEASSIPVPNASFDAVFANCSLEHMDDLDSVLAEVARCLRTGGTLLCSVVTDRFLQWSLLHALVERAGYAEAAQRLREQFKDFHNLVNPLSVEEWTSRLAGAGMVVEGHIPIMPMYNTGIFLMMDSLWHVERPAGGEMGDLIHPFLSANPRFPHAFGTMLKGVMELETDWETCSGAVLRATRRP